MISCSISKSFVKKITVLSLYITCIHQSFFTHSYWSILRPLGSTSNYFLKCLSATKPLISPDMGSWTCQCKTQFSSHKNWQKTGGYEDLGAPRHWPIHMYVYKLPYFPDPLGSVGMNWGQLCGWWNNGDDRVSQHGQWAGKVDHTDTWAQDGETPHQAVSTAVNQLRVGNSSLCSNQMFPSIVYSG